MMTVCLINIIGFGCVSTNACERTATTLSCVLMCKFTVLNKNNYNLNFPFFMYSFLLILNLIVYFIKSIILNNLNLNLKLKLNGGKLKRIETFVNIICLK